jgi:hypothetical protein
MSQENMEDVATLFEVVSRGHWDRVSELLHSEFEFHAAIGAVEQRTYAGAKGMRAFVSNMDMIWDGYRVELSEVREAGAQAVVLMHIQGTARASGVPLK